MRRSSFLAALVLVALVVGGLGACGRDRVEPPTAVDGKTGGTFVYARGKDSPTADPALATDGESALLLANVFDTLVRFKYGAYDVEPALATSWKIADDKRSITFALRDGVVFHDGTPLDAEAVVASFERQRDPKHPAHFQEGPYPYWNDMFAYVTKTSVAGAGSIRIDFATEMPPFFLSLCAMFSSAIVSPKALAKGKEFVARNPVGTGAFRFVSWVNQEITLDANPTWYGGRAKLDRVVLRVVPEPRTARLLLEQGQVHGIDTVAPRDVEPIRKDARLALHQVSPGLSVCYLSMNNDVKPFDDVRVRQAVAFALDKARIVKAAYEGQAAAISTLVPKGMEGYLGLPDRVRDVAKAKALLKEAGALGATVRLHYMGNPRPYVPDPDALAAQIRDDLREAGLEVVLKKEEWAAHLPLMQNGEHQMGILGWSPDVADADNYLHVLLDRENTVKGAANNVSFYRGEAFHQLVTKARTSYDPAERNRLYAQASRIAFDEVPMVPLIAMPRMAATLAKVKGFVLDPISSPRFAWTSLSE